MIAFTEEEILDAFGGDTAALSAFRSAFGPKYEATKENAVAYCDSYLVYTYLTALIRRLRLGHGVPHEVLKEIAAEFSAKCKDLIGVPFSIKSEEIGTAFEEAIREVEKHLPPSDTVTT